jgi:hypothetical protein
MTTAPMNPLAGPAGPGKYSTRTDNLQMGSIAYGEGVDTAAIQSGAPLAKTGEVRGIPTSEVRAVAQEPITSLYAQSARPNEPITSGIDMGAGVGSNALMMPNQAQGQYVDAYQMFSQLAANPEASPTLKYLAQRIQQGF